MKKSKGRRFIFTLIPFILLLLIIDVLYYVVIPGKTAGTYLYSLVFTAVRLFCFSVCLYALYIRHFVRFGRFLNIAQSDYRNLSDMQFGYTGISIYLRSVFSGFNRLVSMFKMDFYKYSVFIKDSSDLLSKEKELVLEMQEFVSAIPSSIVLIENHLSSLQRQMSNLSAETDIPPELMSRIKNDIDSSLKLFDRINENTLSIKESMVFTDQITHNNRHLLRVLAKDIGGYATYSFNDLMSRDNKPLFRAESPEERFQIPKFFPGSDTPEDFPIDDSRHWYEKEYAGWGVEKKQQPESPGDGPAGKRVYIIRMQENPSNYFNAYIRGLAKVARMTDIELQIREGKNYFTSIIKETIAEKPDAVILFADNAEKITAHLSELYRNHIPVIISHSIPTDIGAQMCLSCVCQDDWAQSRKLARKFAEEMEYKGGYCILRSHPTTSHFDSHTYGIITELKKIAPAMYCLDKQPAHEKNAATEIVSEWLRSYGSSLKGIIASDPRESLIGMNNAVDEFDREDIIRMAMGNTQISLTALKENRLKALCISSAEAEGATAVKTAVDWFFGLIIQPVIQIQGTVITSSEVNEYLPAQW